MIDKWRLNAYNIIYSVSYLWRKLMDYMTIKETADKWNLSVRRVQTMCNEGLIEGVIRFGREWAIPKDAVKPVDKRIKTGKYIKSQ